MCCIDIVVVRCHNRLQSLQIVSYVYINIVFSDLQESLAYDVQSFNDILRNVQYNNVVVCLLL